MLLEQKGRVDVEFNGCQEAVYHGADGVFTFMQGVGKNPGITYVTGTKEDKVQTIEPLINDFAYATGTRSIYLSCEMGADEVYIIGHDLYSTIYMLVQMLTSQIQLQLHILEIGLIKFEE